MQRLYTNNKIILYKNIKLHENNQHYLSNVLKIKQHSKIIIFNKCNGEWIALVTIKKNIYIKPYKKLNNVNCNEYKFALVFSLLKNQNTFFIIQKICELNVSEIFPIITTKTAIKKINIKKIKKIIKESCEQSNRINIPNISAPSTIKEIVKNLSCYLIVFCHKNSYSLCTLIKKIQYNKKIAFMIGPENGFSNTELKFLALQKNIININLCDTNLRSETAAVSASFLYHFLTKQH